MKKKILMLGLVLILSSLFIFGCSPNNTLENDDDEVERDILIIGMKSGIFGFQPWMTNYETTTMTVNFNIFNGLVEFDKDYKITPALAYSWENPDPLTWRFHLRKDVMFHNGDSFTAEDVKYTIDFTKADENGVFKDLLAAVDSVEVVDDYTVDIKTLEPFPILLNKLVDLFIISKKYQEETDSKWPIGTGGYKLVEHVEDDHITLERFDDYWKDTERIKTVIYQVINDEDARVNALLTKQIDFAESILPQRVEEIKNSPDADIVFAPSTRVLYLSFDFRETDSFLYGPDVINPTSIKEVREAMYMAIDEDKIISEIMGGLAEPASQFISPNIFGYDQSIKRLPYDIESAKQLMISAGYEDGFDITLDCPNNRYINDEAICNEVAAQLSAININVTVNAQPKTVFFDKIFSKQTGFYLLGWATDTGDGGEIFDYLLHSVEEGLGTYNNGFYFNSKVDELGEKSSTIIDPAERLRIMHEGFRIAADDRVWIPLHLQMNLYGVSSGLKWEPRADVKIKLEDVSFN